MKNYPLKAEVTKFYSDIPAGTIGEVVKVWENQFGKWYKLYLGVNLSGKKLYKHFHHSVIKIL
jgi:hypothetical protein